MLSLHKDTRRDTLLVRHLSNSRDTHLSRLMRRLAFPDRAGKTTLLLSLKVAIRRTIHKLPSSSRFMLVRRLRVKEVNSAEATEEKHRMSVITTGSAEEASVCFKVLYIMLRRAEEEQLVKYC